MGYMVIAAYRPKPGKEQDLLQLLREHMPILRGQGLVTGRPPVVMRAKDGTLIEVFEWRSPQAVEQAHSNPTVQKLWERFEQVCEYVRLADLAECQQPFPNFDTVEP